MITDPIAISGGSLAGVVVVILFVILLVIVVMKGRMNPTKPAHGPHSGHTATSHPDLTNSPTSYVSMPIPCTNSTNAIEPSPTASTCQVTPTITSFGAPTKILVSSDSGLAPVCISTASESAPTFKAVSLPNIRNISTHKLTSQNISVPKLTSHSSHSIHVSPVQQPFNSPSTSNISVHCTASLSKLTPDHFTKPTSTHSFPNLSSSPRIVLTRAASEHTYSN